MPNLKDLKNRIASVKSTRKITKAMQMVAAAKLRRAQDSAEAARPYTERFNAVMAGLVASAQASGQGPRLLTGTGSDQTHLIVVMTAERGLCGGFNSSIVRAARAHIGKLLKAGKTVKILTVGKKGREQLRRDHNDKLVGHVDLSAVKRVGYADAQGVAKDVLTRFEAGEFDVATIFYNTFESVISQIPTEVQIIPAKFEREEGAEVSSFYDYEPSEAVHPEGPAAARSGHADLRGPAGKRRVRTGRADERHGQRDAQRGRDDRQADDRVQPLASGRHHQRAD